MSIILLHIPKANSQQHVLNKQVISQKKDNVNFTERKYWCVTRPLLEILVRFTFESTEMYTHYVFVFHQKYHNGTNDVNLLVIKQCSVPVTQAQNSSNFEKAVTPNTSSEPSIIRPQIINAPLIIIFLYSQAT